MTKRMPLSFTRWGDRNQISGASSLFLWRQVSCKWVLEKSGLVDGGLGLMKREKREGQVRSGH